MDSIEAFIYTNAVAKCISTCDFVLPLITARKLSVTLCILHQLLKMLDLKSRISYRIIDIIYKWSLLQTHLYFTIILNNCFTFISPIFSHEWNWILWFTIELVYINLLSIFYLAPFSRMVFSIVYIHNLWWDHKWLELKISRLFKLAS